MHGKSGLAAVSIMNEHDDLRSDMERRFGEMRADMERRFGEMRDRNADLLKWALVFGATQTAAIAGVVALLR